MPGRSPSGGAINPNIICFKCQAKGHIARNCPTNNNNGRTGRETAVESMFVGCVFISNPMKKEGKKATTKQPKKQQYVNCDTHATWQTRREDVSSFEKFKADNIKNSDRWWADYDESSESDEEYIAQCNMIESPLDESDSNSEEKGETEPIQQEPQGICPNCYGSGEVDDLCVNCAAQGYCFEEATLNLRVARESAFRPVDEVPMPEKYDRMIVEGCGLCSMCANLGIYDTYCHECWDPQDPEDKVPYDDQGELMSELEGICPVCHSPGNLNDLCKACAKWFYARVPDKHHGPIVTERKKTSSTFAKHAKKDDLSDKSKESFKEIEAPNETPGETRDKMNDTGERGMTASKSPLWNSRSL